VHEQPNLRITHPARVIAVAIHYADLPRGVILSLCVREWHLKLSPPLWAQKR
jgi:hypothetical protein